MIRLGEVESTRHLFLLNTDKGKVEVLANTRSQASRIARQAGYNVYDVNMIG